jgi:hypothetical protein
VSLLQALRSLPEYEQRLTPDMIKNGGALFSATNDFAANTAGLIKFNAGTDWSYLRVMRHVSNANPTYALGQMYPYMFGDFGRYLYKTNQLGAEEHEKKLHEATCIEKHEVILSELEQSLASSSSKYIMGDDYVTVVDLNYFFSVAFELRMGRNFDSAPATMRWYRVMMELPSVDAVWPKIWNREDKMELTANARAAAAAAAEAGKESQEGRERTQTFVKMMATNNKDLRFDTPLQETVKTIREILKAGIEGKDDVNTRVGKLNKCLTFLSNPDKVNEVSVDDVANAGGEHAGDFLNKHAQRHRRGTNIQEGGKAFVSRWERQSASEASAGEERERRERVQGERGARAKRECERGVRAKRGYARSASDERVREERERRECGRGARAKRE